MFNCVLFLGVLLSPNQSDVSFLFQETMHLIGWLILSHLTVILLIIRVGLPYVKWRTNLVLPPSDHNPYALNSGRQWLCFLLPAGNAPMTTAVDIYSFGICALEVCILPTSTFLRKCRLLGRWLTGIEPGVWGQGGSCPNAVAMVHSTYPNSKLWLFTRTTKLKTNTLH